MDHQWQLRVGRYGRVIAVTPICLSATHPEPRSARSPSVQMPALNLTASVIDIFTLPVLRQYVLHLVLDDGTYGVADDSKKPAPIWARRSDCFPRHCDFLTEQLLSLDLQGALTTIEAALIGTIAAVGAPILDAFITVRQRISGQAVGAAGGGACGDHRGEHRSLPVPSTACSARPSPAARRLSTRC